MVIAAVASNSIKNRYSLGTVKLGFKELLNKEQTGFWKWQCIVKYYSKFGHQYEHGPRAVMGVT